MLSPVHSGLGDQLQRLFALLALACHTGYTAVVSDNFGEVSEHQSHGYAAEFEFLGIPLKFLRMSAVEVRAIDASCANAVTAV